MGAANLDDNWILTGSWAGNSADYEHAFKHCGAKWAVGRFFLGAADVVGHHDGECDQIVLNAVRT